MFQHVLNNNNFQNFNYFVIRNQNNSELINTSCNKVSLKLTKRLKVLIKNVITFNNRTYSLLENKI